MGRMEGDGKRWRWEEVDGERVGFGEGKGGY
jgi:hypothetical protein